MAEDAFQVMQHHDPESQDAGPDREAGDKHVVLLVHGIRTVGFWRHAAREVFDNLPGVVAVPTGYDWFDAPRFWLPFLTRRRPVRTVLEQLRDAQRRHGNERLSIVAHSFGAYVVLRILIENDDIDVDRLVLCGSVLPRSFRWSRLRTRVGKCLNECGTRDVWPILAEKTSWGYGSSGTFGFASGTNLVEDHFHRIGHSEFFDESANFFADRWAPFILDGALPRRPKPATSADYPRHIRLLNLLPLKWLAAGLFCVLILRIFGSFGTQPWGGNANEQLTEELPSNVLPGEDVDVRIDATDVRDLQLTPGWQLLTQAPWDDRYGHATASFDGKIWLTGGHEGTNSPGSYFDDVWYSSDGREWIRAIERAPWAARASHALVAHDGKLWLLGGVNITLGQGYQGFSDVWHSKDGENWSLVTDSAPWGPRWSHTAVVHNGRIWLLGGVFPQDSSSGIELHRGASTEVAGRRVWLGGSNEAWHSADGISWSQADDAPWNPRWAHASATHSGLIWVMGGYDGQENLNDVWYTGDGNSWRRISNLIPWEPRARHTLTTFDRHLWLLGGTHGDFSSETLLGEGLVWISRDGRHWQRPHDEPSWAHRAAHTALNHRGALFVLGGQPRGQNSRRPYNNEVWVYQGSKK